jgi:hypothetical protein
MESAGNPHNRGALSKQPRIWLADIIKAMTGLPDNSAEPPPLGPGSYWRAAQRQQVAATLFKAARAADHPVFIGSRDRLSDQLIPQEYFDIPRTLDSEDNSVRADMERVRDAQFDAEMANPKKWLNVRVDGAWVADWLKSQLGWFLAAASKMTGLGHSCRLGHIHHMSGERIIPEEPLMASGRT